MRMKVFTKAMGFGALLAGLLTCGSAYAMYGLTSFETMAEVNRFCSADNLKCESVTETESGYTVFYQVFNETSSGPRRGDGDGDPLDGGNG